MEQPSLSLDHHTAFEWRPRLRAATLHLSLSVLVAVASALLVFALWYPYPYRDISGGRELFQLVVSVDIVLGPLLTLAVFNRAKPSRELRRDLAVIVLLQFAGLAYGLWTVHLARPVHMVFEYDRFRVVHQVEIPVELADKVPRRHRTGAPARADTDRAAALPQRQGAGRFHPGRARGGAAGRAAGTLGALWSRT